MIEESEPSELPEQERVRREKLARLRARGVDPYPLGFPRTAVIADLHEEYAALEPGSATGRRVAVAGRVLLNRLTG